MFEYVYDKGQVWPIDFLEIFIIHLIGVTCQAFIFEITLSNNPYK